MKGKLETKKIPNDDDDSDSLSLTDMIEEEQKSLRDRASEEEIRRSQSCIYIQSNMDSTEKSESNESNVSKETNSWKRRNDAGVSDEPNSSTGILKHIDKMSIEWLKTFYKNDDEISSDVDKIEKHGLIDSKGNFEFSYKDFCTRCKGPFLGHKKGSL